MIDAGAARPVALVTGASSGIGRAFAELLGRDRYDVLLVARGEAALEELAADLRGRFGCGATVIASDLAQPGAAQALYDRIAASGAFVEVLVNNAGFATYGPFNEIALAAEREEINLNVLALTELSKLFVAPMVAQRRGRVLNVASTAAFAPGPFMAVYYATKAYVLSFSEALAVELHGSGVTVTCLCPGATATGFQARANLGRSRLIAGRTLPDAMSVARAGYDAMRKGQRLVIPGALNRVTAFTPRLFPRGAVLQVSRYLQGARRH